MAAPGQGQVTAHAAFGALGPRNSSHLEGIMAFLINITITSIDNDIVSITQERSRRKGGEGRDSSSHMFHGDTKSSYMFRGRSKLKEREALVCGKV